MNRRRRSNFFRKQQNFFDLGLSELVGFTSLLCSAPRNPSTVLSYLSPCSGGCWINHWKIGLHWARRWHHMRRKCNPQRQISRENDISSVLRVYHRQQCPQLKSPGQNVTWAAAEGRQHVHSDGGWILLWWTLIITVSLLMFVINTVVMVLSEITYNKLFFFLFRKFIWLSYWVFLEKIFWHTSSAETISQWIDWQKINHQQFW